MKASVCESHLKVASQTSVEAMADDDVLLMVSGKNKLVAKAMKHELGTFKPKRHVHELSMEPDESEAMSRLRPTRSKPGTIDLCDSYFKAHKKPVIGKSQSRRFLPGNTAFVTMRGLSRVVNETMYSAGSSGMTNSPRSLATMRVRRLTRVVRRRKRSTQMATSCSFTWSCTQTFARNFSGRTWAQSWWTFHLGRE